MVSVEEVRQPSAASAENAAMPIDALLRGLLDLLAPPRCAACDAELDPGAAGFCGACAPLLEPLSGAEATVAAYRYGGPLADAIRRYKYGGRAELAAVLGRLLVPAARARTAGLDAIVPVPLHPRRLRERGFDQASLLAGVVAEALGVARRLDLVRRVRPTPAQASLDRAGRLDNVRDAFVASVGARDLRILVIDDVRTTGATAGSVSAALLAAGARRVHSLALALSDEAPSARAAAAGAGAANA
ncbi:MAG: ComF family protein [Sandaracinaceae bacterium]